MNDETVLTGKDLLIDELKNEGFNISKIQANMPLINAVIKILAVNQDAKIALDVAMKEKEDNEKLRQELRARENELDNRFIQLRQDEHDFSAQIKECEKIKEREKLLYQCETPEARDKMRLASFFLAQNISNTYTIRALSNILGNGAGARKEFETKEDTWNENNVTG